MRDLKGIVKLLDHALEADEDVLELLDLDELRYLCRICELLADLGVCDALSNLSED